MSSLHLPYGPSVDELGVIIMDPDDVSKLDCARRAGGALFWQTKSKTRNL